MDLISELFKIQGIIISVFESMKLPVNKKSWKLMKIFQPKQRTL